MVTIEPIESPAFKVRVCPGAHEGEARPDFDASGVLEIDPANPSIAKFSALQGRLTPSMTRELVDKLRECGIEILLSVRKKGHGLPCSVLRPDGYLSTDLAAVAARMARRNRGA